MKFRSRNNRPVRISSTRGHVVIVDQQWIEVPEHMEGDAYAKGCISEEMYETIKGLDAPECEEFGEIADTQATIKTFVNEMIDKTEDGFFTTAGLPNLKVLSAKCGFTVTKDEMMKAWSEISLLRDAIEEEELVT